MPPNRILLLYFSARLSSPALFILPVFMEEWEDGTSTVELFTPLSMGTVFIFALCALCLARSSLSLFWIYPNTRFLFFSLSLSSSKESNLPISSPYSLEPSLFSRFSKFVPCDVCKRIIGHSIKMVCLSIISINC